VNSNVIRGGDVGEAVGGIVSVGGNSVGGGDVIVGKSKAVEEGVGELDRTGGGVSVAVLAGGSSVKVGLLSMGGFKPTG
jgi:hypothetical protein